MKELPEKTGKKVIVSHHAPTTRAITEEFKSSPMNCTFYSDMEKLIKLYNPDYWIYGHSHRNVGDIQIGHTILLSNQLGYVNKGEQACFNRSTCFMI